MEKELIHLCGKAIHITGRMLRIARIEGGLYEPLDDPQSILDGLGKAGIRVDLFTFMQIMPDTSPKYSYPMEWDNLAVLPVSTFDHWWTKQIDGKTRNMVRRAEKKGVVVQEVPFDDVLVQGISEIYNECPVRQGRPFHHYGKDIETVRKEAATFLASSIFVGAFLNDRLIGFAKLTTDKTRRQAGIMHIISMISHREKAPMNALIAQAVRSCAERGISYLVYSNFSYGAKQRDSLSDFKENNGFRRIELPRYYVPRTRIGRVAFRLGLHHSIIHQVPEPLLTKFRELRNVWYNRKPQSVTETS
jgi:hypothetical protein